MSVTTAPALKVEDLAVHYGRSGRRRAAAAPAVEGVSFEVGVGETVGLVGESGSGKSTIVRAILGLAAPTAGTLSLNGQDITNVSVRRRGALVSELRAVFQDPFSSLSPFQTVADTMVDALRVEKLPRGEALERAGTTLESVGLSRQDLSRYPYQFSGGQRQRVSIARALVSNPQLVLMDEPVSALDLSAQAQVLNVLADLRDRQRYAMLFVGHDLGVVRFLCSRVVVLYRGMVMEIGDADEVTTRPRNPYTQALMEASPVPNPIEQAQRRAARHAVRAQASAAIQTAAHGCPFAARCRNASDICRSERPALAELDDHAVACHHPL